MKRYLIVGLFFVLTLVQICMVGYFLKPAPEFTSITDLQFVPCSHDGAIACLDYQDYTRMVMWEQEMLHFKRLVEENLQCVKK